MPVALVQNSAQPREGDMAMSLGMRLQPIPEDALLPSSSDPSLSGSQSGSLTGSETLYSESLPDATEWLMWDERIPASDWPFSGLQCSDWLPAMRNYDWPIFLNTAHQRAESPDSLSAQVDCRYCADGVCKISFIQSQDLPYGWEKVEDPHYGTYFIDHVNRRTQYETPVNNNKGAQSMVDEAGGTFPRPKKPAPQTERESPKRSVSESDMKGAPEAPAYRSKIRPAFTKNVEELNGSFMQASLVKGGHGFGFTIVGAARRDEDFLQIKTIVPNGPAFHNGQLRAGDILLRVNNASVLGCTHQDVIAIFQSIPIGTQVHLDVCRGYAMPSELDDPNTKIVTKLAVTMPADSSTTTTPTPSLSNGASSNLHSVLDNRLNVSQRSLKSLPDLTRSTSGVILNNSFQHHLPNGDVVSNDRVNNSVSNTPDVLNNPSLQNSTSLNSINPEILEMHITKGAKGFGFTIADSAYGQKVKQIVDKQRCINLEEGDILLRVNETSVQGMSHSHVAQCLKECPVETEAIIVVQRGGMLTPGGKKKHVKPPKTPDGVIPAQPISDTSFASNPGAYFFNGPLNHKDKLDDSIVSSSRSTTNSVASAMHDGGLTDAGSSQNHAILPLQALSEDAGDTESRNRNRTPTMVDQRGRSKTPTPAMERRIVSPTASDFRPKTPPAHMGHMINPAQRMKPLNTRDRDIHTHFADDLRHGNANNYSASDYVDHGVRNGGSGYPQDPHLIHSTRPPLGPSRHESWRQPIPGLQDFPGRPEYHQYRPESRQDVNNYAQSRTNINAPTPTPYSMHNNYLPMDRREIDQDLHRGYLAQHGGNRGSERGNPARPGQFRSRTPGPELMSRMHSVMDGRAKTPTAFDMRSKTPVPGAQSHYNNTNYMHQQHGSVHNLNGSSNPESGIPSRYEVNHYNNSPSTQRQAYQNQQNNNQWPHGAPSSHSQPNSPFNSPPIKRNDKLDYNLSGFSRGQERSFTPNNYKSNVNGPPTDISSEMYRYQQLEHSQPNNMISQQRPQRQSTSFENEDPSPSNLMRVPRRVPPLPQHFAANQSSHGTSLVSDVDEHCMELTVVLSRQETGFGFRIIGGTEEGSQVSIGHIVPGGAADMNGRLQVGDEIISVNEQLVMNSSHHQVVELMGTCALEGTVTLGIRRQFPASTEPGLRGGNPNEFYPYDVTVTRRENEGFGFVIISAVTKSGSTIGRILENSPAERCGRLRLGDRILAVNGVEISSIHHEDIVNLIKDSGYSVVLTVGPPQDDTSSTTSTSQRPDPAYEPMQSSQGSLINAMAYPAVSEVDLSQRPLTDYAHYPPPPSLQSHQNPADRFQSVPDRPKELIQQRSYSGPAMPPPEQEEYLNVILHRASRGFGFSIRGGQEFKGMPLYVLRIAEGGAAHMDGRIRVGDQILEINSISTEMMNHSGAIDLIQNGGPTVRLIIKRTGKPPPTIDPAHPQVSSRPGPHPPLANGPISHSSPHLMRHAMDQEDSYHHYGPPPPTSVQHSNQRAMMNSHQQLYQHPYAANKGPPLPQPTQHGYG